MLKAVSVKCMRESDAATIRNKTDSRTLMQRAGEAISRSADFHGKKTLILCGSGNNAGDGYVLSSLLKKEGERVSLCLIKEAFSDDGRYFFEMAKKERVEWIYYEESFDFKGFDIIVDCVFGTGFSGDVREPYRTIFEKVNSSGAFVICADINSGLCGDSGEGDGAIVSDLTVSIGSYKYGHYLGSSHDVMKKRINCDIGIDIIGDMAYVCEDGDFADILCARKRNSHKGTYGYCAIIAGSTSYPGAAKLSNLAADTAKAALRSGCGVVTLAVPESACRSVSPYLLESTLLPLPEKDGRAVFDRAVFESLCAKCRSISCGMGWGEGEEYRDILEFLLGAEGLTLIIDADGINALAKNKEILKGAKARVVLTPHPLEFSRLSGLAVKEILSDPVGCARTFAKEYGTVLLLKGASTVVADEKDCYIVTAGCAGMATAGSGDVLSGILTGLLAYTEPCAKSVACGAHIAGKAGERAGQKYGDISMLSSDTVAHIPEAILTMRKEKI